MDEYLQYMKTLRSQMNDVEEQAAKSSVEEQTRITTFHTFQKDLTSAKSETQQLKEETDQMVKAKGQICSQILEKQRKITSLELDSYNLSQTLELIQQEVIALSTRITEKRSFYTKAAEDINSKLREQQTWIKLHKSCPDAEVDKVVKVKLHEHRSGAQGKELMANLGSAKTMLDGITEMKYNIVSENNKIRKSIEQTKQQINDFQPELRAMDIETLEEEQKALSTDKGGEVEYLQSMQCQIEKLKAISHVIKCACGKEYKVEVNSCA